METVNSFKDAAEWFENDLKDGKCSPECPDCNARELAIIACGKQTPMYVECPRGWRGHKYTRYLCPTCGKQMRQQEKYCHNCGQRVKYPKQECVDNKIVLRWDEEEE